MKAVDLFAGAGALSRGLADAGFEMHAAVESELDFAETFMHNHRGAKCIVSDIRRVPAKEVVPVRSKIQLLVACPPCQGFSQLTKKYRRQDPRNKLLYEVGRFVEELSPTVVMVENVPGMEASGPILNKFLKMLRTNGYRYVHDVIQSANYGVPQDRRRFVLIASKRGVPVIPEPTHARAPANGEKSWVTVKEAFSGLGPSISLLKSKEYGGPRKFNWHVNRDLTEINLKRIQAISTGENRMAIPEELKPKCHSGGYGGFSNVYGRMRWDHPSPTITAGCTVLSKGRFGHPKEDRTISVREAARLQTYPDDFEFCSDYIGRVCTMIGNAFPVKLAEVLGEQCSTLVRSRKRLVWQ